jgi:Flp pilus assembly protein TadD
MRIHSPRQIVAACLPAISAIGLAWALGGFVVFGQANQTAASLEEAGQRLAEAGDLKGAEAELRRAAEISPRDSAVLASLGQVLESEGRLEEAGANFARALELDSSNDAIRGNLAVIQWRRGQLTEAKANLERLLKNKPGDAPTLLLLGMVEENLKNYQGARELLASVPALVRQRPESIAALARAYYRTGEREKGRATLKELEGNAAGPDGIFLGGQVAAQADDFNFAEGMFTSIWSTYPDKPRLGYELAREQFRANRWAESEATSRKLIAAGYESGEIYDLLGKCLDKRGNFKQALAAMQRAIELNPSREGNYLDVGTILAEHRRFPAALVMAQRAVEVAPRSSQAYAFKGFVESKMSKHTQAETSYARAVELDPAAPEALMGLALAQWDNGKSREAEGTFKNGLARFPRNANFHQEYGIMLLDTGATKDPARKSQAVALLQTATRLDGSLAEPHYRLGNLALTEGKASEALEELREAAQLNPRSSKVHYALSRAYSRLGRSEDAKSELRTYQTLKAEQTKAESEEPGTDSTKE